MNRKKNITEHVYTVLTRIYELAENQCPYTLARGTLTPGAVAAPQSLLQSHISHVDAELSLITVSPSTTSKCPSVSCVVSCIS